MSMTINTNMASLNAQRNLSKTQGALSKSLERLSSGLRINSAKDDAAGLAISTRFSSQIRGLDQSVRNANDGISLLQTSEGAMQEVTSLLQRMREIAVQASNDTYSTSDRASLQGEVDQLYDEIDRISSSTQFNGINLLDGSGGTRSFQIGANSGQNITVELKSVATSDLNLNMSPLGELNSGRVGACSATGLTINGTAISAAATTTNSSDGVSATAATAKDAINLKTDLTGVTATAYNTVKGVAGTGIVATGELKINGKFVAASGNMDELVTNINEGTYGVTATLNEDNSITLSNDTGDDIVIANTGAAGTSGLTSGTSKGYLSLVDDSGNDINVTATGATTASLNLWGFNASSGSGSVVSGASTSTIFAVGDLILNGVSVGTTTATTAAAKATAINLVSAQSGVSAATSAGEIITLTSDTGDDIVISGTSAATMAKAGFVEQGGSDDAVGAGLSVGSVDKANEVIDLVDAAMNLVSENRADLGAVQNRLDSTISNLMNVSENLSAANGRILDADFAAETAAMSKQQILVQAGVAMLAQAKSIPQQVLQLLQ